MVKPDLIPSEEGMPLYVKVWAVSDLLMVIRDSLLYVPT
jgi:hypothetical protein